MRRSTLRSALNILCVLVFCSMWLINYNLKQDMRNPMPGPFGRGVATEPCTLGQFRRYFSEYEELPKGHWDMTGDVLHFVPSFCKPRYPRIDNRYLGECLLRANISSIVTMGDSNGARYSNVMFDLLSSAAGENCRRLRRENLSVADMFMPDKQYFQNGMHNDLNLILRTRRRQCKRCSSEYKLCRELNGTPHNVTLERIGMSYILDTTVSPDVFFSLITYQEFIFRYYLQDHFPDFMFIFLPFNHVKKRVALPRISADLAFLRALVKIYIPTTTKVFLIPAFAEFESKKPKEWENVKFDGMLASAKIHRLNNLLFDTFRTDFVDKSNIYGFLDLVFASMERETWNLDGVHMVKEWYECIVSLLLETICTSYELSDL